MENTKRVYILYNPTPDRATGIIGVFTNLDSLDNYLQAAMARPLGERKRQQLAEGVGIGIGKPGMATVYVQIEPLDPEFPAELYS